MTWVQTAAATAVNAATCTTGSFAATTTAGNTLSVITSIRGSVVVSSVVSQTSGGATVDTLVKQNDVTDGLTTVGVWAILSGAGGASKFLITLPSSAKQVCSGAEYSGVGSLSATATGGGSSASCSVSITGGSSDRKVMGCAAQGVGTFSAGSGTLRTSATTSGGSGAGNVGGALCDTVDPTNCAVTISASEAWTAIAQNLVVSGGGPACPNTRLLLGVGC